MSERGAGILLAGLLAGFLTGCLAPARPPPPAAGCRSGPPEAGVRSPERLEVLEACAHAEGRVVQVVPEEDGDLHVWIVLDAGYERLLNAENHYQARPALLAEITPECPSPPADAKAAARCPRSRLPVPRIGDHVALDGPWVLDTGHGWREIHPVSFLRIKR